MNYLIYENQVFKQSHYNESDFFSLKDPSLYFLIKRIFEIISGSERFEGILCKDNNHNVIERNVSLNIFEDARGLISTSNVGDWIIRLKQTDEIYHIRDIYLSEGFEDSDGYSEPDYFAINLSDTSLGDKFEDPCRVDIYNINDYELYHKENDNYILVYKTSKV